MQINPIMMNCHSNISRQSFGAKLTPKAKEELYRTGEYYLLNYGEKSERFTQFKTCVDAFKTLCPNLTIDLERGKDFRTKQPAIKATLYDNGQKCKEVYYIDDSNTANLRFRIDSMQDLTDKMVLAETELKQADNPEFTKTLLTKIIEG